MFKSRKQLLWKPDANLDLWSGPLCAAYRKKMAERKRKKMAVIEMKELK